MTMGAAARNPRPHVVSRWIGPPVPFQIPLRNLNSSLMSVVHDRVMAAIHTISRAELSEPRLALKESLCRGTLRTVAALGAGDAHLRGLLLYHLHAALAERARRSTDLYEELKSEIESTIEQAYNILQGDISAPPDLELRRRYLGPGCDKPHEERFFILDS